jgi:hypothetical protein
LEALGMEASEVIYLGTPQTEMSLYNALPERGYEVRIWPARFPSDQLATRYGEKLAPLLRKMLEERPALSVRLQRPRRAVRPRTLRRHRPVGARGVLRALRLRAAVHARHHVSDADRYPLKLSDLLVMAIDLRWLR